MSARLEASFGFAVDVMVRSRPELEAVVAGDPFAGVADNPSRQHVAFLSGEPGADALAALLAVEAEPERLVAAGRELHLWTPNGMTGSVLAKELGRAKLGVCVTVRNWNTVVKLLGMVRPAG